MFPEKFEAWMTGPLIPALYWKFKPYGIHRLAEPEEAPEPPCDVAKFLTTIADDYLAIGECNLDEMTTRELILRATKSRRTKCGSTSSLLPPRPGVKRAHVLPPQTEPERLRFSFRYLDTQHPQFSVVSRDGAYFRLLLSRLRDLSGLFASEFRTRHLPSSRNHPIDFADPRVSVEGLGLPPALEADVKAWQFSLSASEHGRVHGFLAGNTFFVRWLDPDHRLYSAN